MKCIRVAYGKRGSPDPPQKDLTKKNYFYATCIGMSVSTVVQKSDLFNSAWFVNCIL